MTQDRVCQEFFLNKKRAILLKKFGLLPNGGRQEFLYETLPFFIAVSNCLFISHSTSSTSFNIVSRVFIGVKEVKL